MGYHKMPTETVLQLLENGEWHYIKDLPKLTSLSSLTVNCVTQFLEKYNFVKLDQRKQKIKLEKPTTAFLRTIRDIENEERIQKI